MRATELLAAAAAWPGEPPQGHVLPIALAGFVGLASGSRAALWQLAAWGIAPVGELAKRAVNRPRPLRGRFNAAGGKTKGSSFPSTHAANYVVYFGFAGWILGRHRSPALLPVLLVGLPLMAMIGPSRVGSGDHRWSDVIGGYALGGVYLAVLVMVANRDDRTISDGLRTDAQPPTVSPATRFGAPDPSPADGPTSSRDRP